MDKYQAQEDLTYFRLLAHYSKGFPAQQYLDICIDPAECAADGRCRVLAEFIEHDND